jgi:hypothetical protein
LHQNLKTVCSSFPSYHRKARITSFPLQKTDPRTTGDKAVEKTPLLLYIYCNDWALAVSNTCIPLKVATLNGTFCAL